MLRERADPAMARYRQMEAQLGYEPDVVDGEEIGSFLNDVAALDDEATGEVVLDATGGEKGKTSPIWRTGRDCEANRTAKQNWEHSLSGRRRCVSLFWQRPGIETRSGLGVHRAEPEGIERNPGQRQ